MLSKCTKILGFDGDKPGYSIFKGNIKLKNIKELFLLLVGVVTRAGAANEGLQYCWIMQRNDTHNNSSFISHRARLKSILI